MIKSQNKNNKLHIILNIFCTFILMIASIFLTMFVLGYRLDINLSSSLPNRIFISNLNFNSIENGNYVKFLNPKAKYYTGRTFTKKVLGQGGDKIIIKKFQNIKDNIQGAITINNTTLNVKYKTNKGTLIHILDLKTDTIPNNKLFVYGISEDSYDSRYEEFGLIDKTEVISVSVPLF